jgi:hypothetical protein
VGPDSEGRTNTLQSRLPLLEGAPIVHLGADVQGGYTAIVSLKDEALPPPPAWTTNATVGGLRSSLCGVVQLPPVVCFFSAQKL